MAAPSGSDYILIKTIYSNSAWKIRPFNVSFAEFGWDLANLLWKQFEKLFYFQASEDPVFKTMDEWGSGVSPLKKSWWTLKNKKQKDT